MFSILFLLIPFISLPPFLKAEFASTVTTVTRYGHTHGYFILLCGSLWVMCKYSAFLFTFPCNVSIHCAYPVCFRTMDKVAVVNASENRCALCQVSPPTCLIEMTRYQNINSWLKSWSLLSLFAAAPIVEHSSFLLPPFLISLSLSVSSTYLPFSHFIVVLLLLNSLQGCIEVNLEQSTPQSASCAPPLGSLSSLSIDSHDAGSSTVDVPLNAEAVTTAGGEKKPFCGGGGCGSADSTKRGECKGVGCASSARYVDNLRLKSHDQSFLLFVDGLVHCTQ